MNPSTPSARAGLHDTAAAPVWAMSGSVPVDIPPLPPDVIETPAPSRPVPQPEPVPPEFVPPLVGDPPPPGGPVPVRDPVPGQR